MNGIRIIGGRHRGRHLKTPTDRSVRPTSERAREALFDMLDHAGLVAGARFLDLFCGTGAVGLEAFSRGAAEVWLIDHDISLARENVDALDRPEAVQIQRMDAVRLRKAPRPFDVVFMDPPYRSGLASPALDALRQGWLEDDALLIVELAAKETLDLPEGFEEERERRYGAARLVFLRFDRQGPETRPS